MYTYTIHCMHSTSAQVFTFLHNHLLHTDPTLSRQTLKLAVDRSDLDFVKHLVNNLRMGVIGKLNDIHYLYRHAHTNKHLVQIVDILIIHSMPSLQAKERIICGFCHPLPHHLHHYTPSNFRNYTIIDTVITCFGGCLLIITFFMLLDPELLMGTLKLTVVRGERKFLKYLIDNHSVDVNGEYLAHTCRHTSHTHSHACTHVLICTHAHSTILLYTL